jgi:hypothetical protein
VLVAIVGTLVLLLCVAVVVAIGTDRGPSPDDVAVSYEHAWDRLDFAALFTLSASELRDGLSRKDFIATKRAAYAQRAGLRNLAANVVAEDSVVKRDRALVTTRVDLRNAGVVRDLVELVRRSGRWQVVAYRETTPGPESRTRAADRRTR